MTPTASPRISLTLMLLIVVPWTIVLSAWIAFATLPPPPTTLAKDAIEMEALGYALRQYRQRYGAFPPDFTSGNPRQEIDDHLRNIFPARDTERDVPPNVDSLGPDQALAFWLRGFCNDNIRFPLTGQVSFGTHPQTGDEILVNADAVQVEAEVYDASEGDELMMRHSMSRLIPTAVIEDPVLWRSVRRLLPRLDELGQRTEFHRFGVAQQLGDFRYRLRCGETPLVYFRADRYHRAVHRAKPPWGTAVPYQRMTAREITFVEPNEFQIICAGADAYFGSPQGAFLEVYQPGHADNLISGLPMPVGARPLQNRYLEARWLLRLSPLVAILCSCAYPLFLLLRDPGSHLNRLGTLIRRQSTEIELSPAWQDRLQAQHARHRADALTRLRREEEKRAMATPAGRAES
ncbi:MAG: hypothetical protein AAGF97_18280 [Planctomycetota bacterium]